MTAPASLIPLNLEVENPKSSKHTMMSTPAEKLTGRTLANGWVVGNLIVKGTAQTGGHFSCSYDVSDGNGTAAFLKAMDYTRALASPDPASELHALTSAFLFERETLQECFDKRMSRIVRAIDSGKIMVDGTAVEYLIFEKARGDIRSYLNSISKFELVWALTCIHNICVGIQQLNGALIAHQDLKPSNVLDFDADEQKLADLGRAWHRNRTSPHDPLRCAGDLGYAPPELLYGYTDPNESDRRFGSDFYLVGSMVLFLFTGCGHLRCFLTNSIPYTTRLIGREHIMKYFPIWNTPSTRTLTQ